MKLLETGAKILFSRVGQVLANAAVVLFVAKTLGPEGQGHYSLTVAVTMLLAALLGGGMGLAAVPPLRQNRVPAGRMLAAQMVWALVMAALLLAAAWITTGGRAVQFLHEFLGWQRGLGFVAAIAATAILAFEIFSYDLLARGRLVVSAAVNGGRAVGHLLLVLILAVTSTLSLGWAVGALTIAHTCGSLIMLAVLLREVRSPSNGVPTATETGSTPTINAGTAPPGAAAGADGMNSADIPADLAERSLGGLILFNLRRGWLGQISAVAYFLLLRLDQGILAHFRGAAEVGIYSVAAYVGEMLWLLPGALTPLLIHSSAADATDTRRDSTASRAARLGFLLTLAAGLPLFFLAKPLLSLLAGGEYAASGDSLRALLPGIVAFAPGAVLAGDFIGRGKPHWNTQASALTVLVNVAVGLVLIPRHGAVGAAWASSIAYACGSMVMLLRFRQATRRSS